MLAVNQLYINNKTERFSFKSGHTVWVVELMKEDWPIVLQNFGLKQLYTTIKSFITKVLEYKYGLNKRIKFVCVAMCSLVMSLCSCDLSMTSLITIQ